MKTIKLTKADFDADGVYKGNLDLTTRLDASVEIEADLGTVRFPRSLMVTGYIRAGAGTGISAGRGISAGTGISAGGGISAGQGISAGEDIRCKGELAAQFRIFAGTAPWLSDDRYAVITCGKLVKGTVAYGRLDEAGLEEEAVDPEPLTLESLARRVAALEQRS